jgi:Holliday junction DNA helicase RuvA
MIGYLKGRVLRSTLEKVLLDVGGVGYEVHVSLGTAQAVERAASKQAPVELFIHTHLREDGIALFGFSTEPELELFQLLISVTGIGPKLARTILSGAAPEDLIGAIFQGDVRRLQQAPGVGKKTAERIVLELSDKVGPLAARLPAASATAVPSTRDDLVSAMVNLGYRPADAEAAVRAALQDAPEAAFQDLLRLSLKRLSKA